ncbi:MAG: PAS domain-containing protein [Sedimenticola sp.]
MSSDNPLSPSRTLSSEELIEVLQEELQETNQGLLALAMELENARDNYQGIFDNAFDGIYQATLDGRYTMVNQSVARILGLDSSRMVVEEVNNIGLDVYADEARYNFLLKELRCTVLCSISNRASNSGMARRDGSARTSGC